MDPERKVNILLVDDEPRNLTALDVLLAAPERNLVTAGSGEEALRQLLHADFAVILLDVRMPGIDGFETAALIRERDRTRDTPIIFLTADSASADLAHRGYSLGAVDYILKPLDPDILRSKVAVFVDLYRKTEQTRVQARQLAELNLKLAHRSQLLEAKLDMLADLGDVLRGTIKEDTLLDELLRRCLDASRVARGAAYLLDRRGRLVLRAQVGYPTSANRALRDFFGRADLLQETIRAGEQTTVPSPSVPGDQATKLLARANARALLIAPLGLRGEPLGAIVLASVDTPLAEDQESFARVISGHASQAVMLGRTLAERAELLARERSAHRAAETARRRFAFLAEVSSELASSLETDAPLQQVAQRAVPEIADLCMIELMAEDGPIRCVVAAFGDPTHMGLSSSLVGVPRDAVVSPGAVRALHVGETLLFASVGPDDLAEVSGGGERQRILAAVEMRSAMVAPLMTRGHALGALTLVRSRGRGAFNADDVALAEDLARRVATAVDNGRLYEEARAAVRMRDEFFTAASHDLKTPITAIKGQAQLLQRRAARAENVEAQRVADASARIVGAANKMQGLVDELLDLARARPGSLLELDRRPTDLVALARQVVGEISRAGGHEVTVESTETELVGDWDAIRMERVLSNLVSNALKYSPAGGRVRVAVTLDPSGQAAVLRVTDTGMGIPGDELPQIFERFYRGRNVIGKIAGTGIGLASVRQIVEQHGGRVEADSTEGDGTTFTVHLPVAAHADRAPEPMDGAPTV